MAGAVRAEACAVAQVAIQGRLFALDRSHGGMRFLFSFDLVLNNGRYEGFA